MRHDGLGHDGVFAGHSHDQLQCRLLACNKIACGIAVLHMGSGALLLVAVRAASNVMGRCR